MACTNSLTLFPKVVLLNVYYNLDLGDLYSCSLVNKHFNKLFDNDLLWDKLIHEHYDDDCVVDIILNYNTKSSKLIYKVIHDLVTINEMFVLGQSICSLMNLRELDLGYKQLSSLPKEIGSLINLQSLTLSNNRLKKLPKEIGCLINLRALYVGSNNLRELPKEIGSLINLHDLYLYGNKIVEVPYEIKSLANLTMGSL